MASNLLKGLRTQHWYGLVMRELDVLGVTDYELHEPRGRGHPKLVVRYNGKVFKTPVPSSERGGGDHKYLVARLRKWFYEASSSSGQNRQEEPK